MSVISRNVNNILSGDILYPRHANEYWKVKNVIFPKEHRTMTLQRGQEKPNDEITIKFDLIFIDKGTKTVLRSSIVNFYKDDSLMIEIDFPI
jgi:hypothetical protein